MALNFLIGHRGVGKSSLLRRISSYVPEARCYDLDEEIEKQSGQSIESLFRAKGEAAFRELEKNCLAQLLTQLVSSEISPIFIALGAGFEGELPSSSERWWIRRKGDALGRIFLDRPRLDSRVSALEEFQGRFGPRETRYAAMATREVFLREGTDELSDAEAALFRNEICGVGGALTLFSSDLEKLPALNAKQSWGLQFFELRDDLLSDDEIQAIAKRLPPEKILRSFRRPEARVGILSPESTLDWDLRLGPPPPGLFEHRLVLSVHGDDFDESLALMDVAVTSYPNATFKFAPRVETFSQLIRGDEWRRSDASRRSFLPHSSDGRWAWYRLYVKGQNPLNFWREGEGSSRDQPTLLEWLGAPIVTEGFAAVLGSPVVLSHSPVEQGRAFAARGVPFYAIDVRAEEWESAFRILETLGLRWVAVTAPLKEKAFESVEDREDLSPDLKSLNTLERRPSGRWRGTNTDVAGLREALKEVPKEATASAVVWGGGGVLSTIKKLLPAAGLYSVRSGRARDGVDTKVQPELLIWAGAPSAHWPSVGWKPRWVLDLNYREDSRARDYALACEARYISGQNMFRAQARGQREFWGLEAPGAPAQASRPGEL